LSAKLKKISGRIPDLSHMQRQAYRSFRDNDAGQTERFCAQILKYRPDDFDALHLLGLLNFELGRMTEALHYLSAALRANSSSAEAMSNLARALDATARTDEAIASYRQALQIAPDHPEIRYNLGNTFLKLGRLQDALASFERVLAVEAGHAGALVNRGNTLLKLNHPVEAIASYDAALAVMPGHPQILTNRGHAWRRLDKPRQALEDFKSAIAVAPNFAEAHFEEAMALLTLGDFAAGLRAYEWRWATGAFAAQRRQLRSPLWLGQGAIAGKTILLHAEQGFGDTIQFIRYAPMVAGLGARVVVEVQPELQTLLSQIGDVDVIPSGRPLGEFDWQCPLLSLPLAFSTRPETIPAAIPYLAAPADRVAYWRERLPPARSRAGFVWSGRSTHNNDRNRSIALKRFRALFEIPGLQCVGLQSDTRAEDFEVMRDISGLLDCGGEISDFADTAALISLMDIVVSVDTAVAHLAGALGKPVLILLPYAADFRWLRGSDRTPWYPSAQLFRQPAFGDWESVIVRVRDELEKCVACDASGELSTGRSLSSGWPKAGPGGSTRLDEAGA
jgi:tetratricopeptide (TPR) repeat protein